MKDKYADLISQMERAIEAHEAALKMVKAMEATIDELPGVLGMSGGITYLGDKFEKERAIHLDEKNFIAAAIDCGSDFSHRDLGEYTRFDCTVLGYRVLTLVRKGSEEEASLLNLIGGTL